MENDSLELFLRTSKREIDVRVCVSELLRMLHGLHAAVPGHTSGFVSLRKAENMLQLYRCECAYSLL